MALLAARGISKYFRDTGTLADDRVSIALAEGETRAIVGENGAGKSTLARIIAGLVAQDSGRILVRGRPLRGGSVREAEAAGIGFVPQISLLAQDLTVAENIALGREPRSMGIFLSKRKAYVEAAMLADRFGFRLDPEALLSSLTTAERRQAEIARALARGGDILVLDEPTSILSEAESEGLFELLRRLANKGKGILLITHRLSEVLKAADSITVLRDGAVVADMRAEDADEAELSALMARGASRRQRAGTSGRVAPKRDAGSRAKTILEIRGIRLVAGTGPLNVSVKEGEVLAVTALAGNGLGRLEDYASGMIVPREGRVLIKGKSMESIPRDKLRSELLGYAPSDREGRGLCLPAAMRENILALRLREFGVLEWVGKRGRNEAAREMAAALGLAADPGQFVSSLSGGNRQRLLLARELDRPRPLLVLSEPMQGLDLASQAEVAALIRELASKRSAILLLSSNVEDVLDVADRVIALYRGEAAFEGINEGASTAAKLLAAMMGGTVGTREGGSS